MNNHLTNQAIQTICQKHLGLNPENIRESHGANHKVYILEGQDKCFVLKTGQNTGWINRQLAIEKLLNNHDIPNPSILAHGNQNEEISEPWLLMAYGGTSLNRAKLPRSEWEKMVFESGKMLARIHSVSFDRPGWIKDGKLEPADHFSSRIAYTTEALAWCLKEKLLTDAEIEDINRVLDRRARSPLSTLCHGDFTLANVLVRDGHVSYVIDWDDISADDPYVDIARWEMGACYWEYDFTFAREGYISGGRSLEQYDEQRIPLIIQRVLIEMYKSHNRDKNVRYRSVLHTLIDT